MGGSCNPAHPVAVWQSNGDSDGTVTPTSAASARDYFVKANGCSSTTHAVDPSPCVTYDGCKDGYPVTWCLFSGGHAMPSFGPDAIAAFFKTF
jgi:polyhydroxybutyrate depolymerase